MKEFNPACSSDFQAVCTCIHQQFANSAQPIRGSCCRKRLPLGVRLPCTYQVSIFTRVLQQILSARGGWLQIKMTGLLALVAVPLNTLFGVTAAIQITRNEFRGKSVLISLLDLPFSISPVVAGGCLTCHVIPHLHISWPAS